MAGRPRVTKKVIENGMTRADADAIHKERMREHREILGKSDQVIYDPDDHPNIAYAHIIMGDGLYVVALKLGISISKFIAWRKQYPEFEDRVQAGLDWYNDHTVSSIVDAMRKEAVAGNVQAAKVLLAALDRDRFGDKIHVDHNMIDTDEQMRIIREKKQALLDNKPAEDIDIGPQEESVDVHLAEEVGPDGG